MEGAKKETIRAVESKDLFHIIHKVPVGNSPYVRAKYLQLVDKDLDASIIWFWKAINNGDRVDSALKDMALVMKQQNRPEEAIEAIKSFRHSCSKLAQESLDNVLIDLYKKCGMIDDQIALLKKKLKMIYTGEAFNGKTTKTARSHGKKFQVSIAQETSRVLGNLGWAYMQQGNYKASEAVYIKAQMIDADPNKAYNLGLCLIKQGRVEEARHILFDILSSNSPAPHDSKIVRRATALLHEIGLAQLCSGNTGKKSMEEEVIDRISVLLNEWAPLESIFEWAPLESIFDHNAIYEEISPQRDEIAC